MSSFITLKRNDSDFTKYLDGSFSQVTRAIPIQSLNLDVDEDTVTFKLVALKDLPAVSVGRLWARLLKLNSLFLVILPILLVAANAMESAELSARIHWTCFAWASVASLFMYFGWSLRNDYVDHMEGVDRLHIKDSEKPIQSGAVTAQSVRHLSGFFLLASFSFSIPVYLLEPQVLWLAAGLFVLVLVSRIFTRSTYKFKLFYEFFLFLFFGPGLFSGLSLSIVGSIPLRMLLLSVVFGWMSVFFLYLKYFENIVTGSQLKMANTITWLGFDRSRIFLAGQWACFLLLLFFYLGSVFGTRTLVLIAYLSLMATAPQLAALKKLKSPLGSEHLKVVRSWRRLFYFVALLVGAQSLWSLTL